MTRPRPLLLAAVFLLAIAACQREAPPSPDWPELGSKDDVLNIDPLLLPTPEGFNGPLYTEPYNSPLSPARFYEDQGYPDLNSSPLVPGVLMHHYPHVTVAGHFRATGTYVYFLLAEGVFYLYGDDLIGHNDGMVGPFPGEPWLVLPTADSRSTEPE